MHGFQLLPCLLGTGWFLAMPNQVHSISSTPEPYTVAQPDGTQITLVLQGDDRLNWDEDPEGYVVVPAKDPATGKDIFKFGQFNATSGEYVATEFEVGKITGEAAGLLKGYQDPGASERVRAASETQVPALATCLESKAQQGMKYTGSPVTAPLQATDDEDCKNRCAGNNNCRFWSFEANTKRCTMMANVQTTATASPDNWAGCVARIEQARVFDSLAAAEQNTPCPLNLITSNWERDNGFWFVRGGGFDQEGQGDTWQSISNLKKLACGNGGDPNTFLYVTQMKGINEDNVYWTTRRSIAELKMNGVIFFRVENPASQWSALSLSALNGARYKILNNEWGIGDVWLGDQPHVTIEIPCTILGEGSNEIRWHAWSDGDDMSFNEHSIPYCPY